jgi:integrase
MPTDKISKFKQFEAHHLGSAPVLDFGTSVVATVLPHRPEHGERQCRLVARHQRRRRAKRLGFVDLRFHDLRGTHATQLLNRGVSVHVVAQRAWAMIRRWCCAPTPKTSPTNRCRMSWVR